MMIVAALLRHPREDPAKGHRPPKRWQASGQVPRGPFDLSSGPLPYPPEAIPEGPPTPDGFTKRPVLGRSRQRPGIVAPGLLLVCYSAPVTRNAMILIIHIPG